MGTSRHGIVGPILGHSGNLEFGALSDGDVASVLGGLAVWGFERIGMARSIS